MEAVPEQPSSLSEQPEEHISKQSELSKSESTVGEADVDASQGRNVPETVHESVSASSVEEEVTHSTHNK